MLVALGEVGVLIAVPESACEREAEGLIAVHRLVVVGRGGSPRR